MTVIVCRGTHPGFGMSPSWQEPPSFEPVPKLCPALVASCLASLLNFNLTFKDAVGCGGRTFEQRPLGWVHLKAEMGAALVLNELGLHFPLCHLLALLVLIFLKHHFPYL